jgi:hypothetical protein
MEALSVSPWQVPPARRPTPNPLRLYLRHHVQGTLNSACGINKDNLNNHSASPTLLSGSEYIYQQYQQLEINNKNNSLASANVGRAQKLFKLSLE